MDSSDTNTTEAGLSRRNLFRAAAAVAVAAPILTEGALARAAAADASPAPKRRRVGASPHPPGAVLINANENPLGPCEAACAAIASIAPSGGRYDLTDETPQLVKVFAAQNGLKEEYVAVYAGSSEPLHYSVLAFTSPERGLVVADPSYEAPMFAALTSGAKISKTALTADTAHDVKAMVAADPKAGVIYICNPNNPTGTLTKRADIVWALENKPKGSILLVDEAYIHLSDAQNVLDLVAADKDLIVLRTFSKIYGMAGIRCGLAVGRPDLLAKLEPYGQNAMPITGSVAARVSLQQPDLIPTRKKIIADTRADTIAWLKANNYKVVGEPVSNCLMIQTGRDGKAVFNAMKDKNVYIGRTWPVWPDAVRVSIGTPAEMAKFKVAFKEVMDGPALAAVDAPTRLAAAEMTFPHFS